MRSTLLSMGFSRRAVVRALQQFTGNNRLDAAIEWLLSFKVEDDAGVTYLDGTKPAR